jgi:hypothetical protein
MAPIISAKGGLSSQAYGQFSVSGPSASFDSIATSTVGAGGASFVTFSSIPSTYKHLQIRIFGADDDTGSSYGNMTFNSDTGANYASHQLFGDGSSVQANNFPSNNQIYIHRIPGNITNVFGGVIVDILDYANTSKYKTVKTLGGYDANNATCRTSFASGVWMNTNAINSILISTGGSKWLQYTNIALYGIKG